MPRYKLTLEYHGGPFVGWQRQENGPSVQGAVEAALRALEPEAPGIAGAGRTDSGVHATGQVAHCDLEQDWEPFRLAEALNWHLKPAPIAVLAAEPVADEFHARFSATGRRYLYRIICRRAPLAIEAGLAWRVGYDLDAGAMQEAADCLVGRHDFTTFRSAKCQAESPVKTLDEFRIERDGTEIRFHLAARSFLHNQVRSFVGTLERVGAGKWPVARVAEALAARDRAACGPVAPPEGLYLAQVTYG
ncbi:MAG TPA: tRNA pseudouridine(38-40) synthase TruA [Thermohalobaculum sp.]|nr:tRNA pseudouridine(38-40) synthase TruA [Thermohalobaculum sp.]